MLSNDQLNPKPTIRRPLAKSAEIATVETVISLKLTTAFAINDAMGTGNRPSSLTVSLADQFRFRAGDRRNRQELWIADSA